MRNLDYLGIGHLNLLCHLKFDLWHLGVVG